MRLAASVLGGLLATACVTTRPSPRPSSTAVESPLARIIQEELLRDAPLDVAPGSGLGALKDRHVLFIGGFLHEVIPGYFLDNIAVAEQLGATTSTLFPRSTHALSADVELIRDEVQQRFQADGRRIILIGHSKGGAGALLTVLRSPELVLSGTVDAVIVIQGALGGSPVADGILRKIPLTSTSFLFGLESLTTHEAKTEFHDAVAALQARLRPDEVAWLFSRIFYVRASTEREVAPELLITHRVLHGYGSGHSDGLMLEEDEKLDQGVDLGVLESDHASLTVSSVLSQSTPRQRQAFTRALFRQVFATP